MSETIIVKVTSHQKATIKRAAEDAGLESSAWIRQVLMESAKRQPKSRQRREGVTIPSAQTQTPPADYKTAAPPRRGPLSEAIQKSG
jgi:hypothetical protein